MTLEESAARMGAHRWMEMRLFEILGGWVGSTEDLAVKATLDRHSQHHAWRAAQWWDRLPVLATIDRDALVRPPSTAMEAAVAEVAAAAQVEVAAAAEVAVAAVAEDTVTGGDAGDRGTVIERLAGVYRVLIPRLVVSYRDHRALASTVADGPAIRTLELVTADLTADWLEGEAHLQRLATTPHDVIRVAAVVRRVEETLVGGGGSAG